MLPLISVVIPVYRVEHFLQRCVESVLNQTYENFEIILVEDGSPDLCGDLCDDYARRFSNVRVIHQQNQGVSIARNNGVAHAKGEYVAFVDGDDYVLPNYLSSMFETQRAYDVSIVCSDYVMVSNEEQPPSSNELPSECIGSEEALMRLCNGQIASFCWGKLFDSKIIKKYSFPEGVIMCEDIWAILRILGDSNKIGINKSKEYCYVQHESSVVHRAPTYQMIHDHLMVADDRLKYIQERFPKIREDAVANHAIAIITIVERIICTEHFAVWMPTLKKKIREDLQEVYKSKKVRRNKKIRMFAVALGTHSTKIIWSLINVKQKTFSSFGKSSR